MSKNPNANDLFTSDRKTNRTFYERLTSNPAHGLAFVIGVGVVSLAAVQTITGQQLNNLGRWSWLFQLTHDWMGAYGPNILMILVGTFLICWAVIGANKQVDHTYARSKEF